VGSMLGGLLGDLELVQSLSGVLAGLVEDGRLGDVLDLLAGDLVGQSSLLLDQLVGALLAGETPARVVHLLVGAVDAGLVTQTVQSLKSLLDAGSLPLVQQVLAGLRDVGLTEELDRIVRLLTRAGYELPALP
jgi:hypothetical protein